MSTQFENVQISTTTGTVDMQVSTTGPYIAVGTGTAISAPYSAYPTYTPLIINNNITISHIEAMVDVINGFELLPIDFTDSEFTKRNLERVIRENYRYKNEIGENVRLGMSSAKSAALTLPWIFAYLFSKRSEYEDCAAYVVDVCNRKFLKNGILSLTGPSESIWNLFACYEGTLAKIALEFAAFCQAL
jgi:hypothetical protein